MGDSYPREWALHWPHVLSSFLDTSLTVRYLVGSPPETAEWAVQVVDGEERLLITDVVLAETAHVLSSVYRVRRQTIVDHLVGLVQKQNISTFGLDTASCYRPYCSVGPRAAL